MKYFGVICRPSDHTGGGPRDDVRTRTAVYRSRDTNPKTATPEWEVVPLLIAAHLEEDLLEDVDGAGGAEEVERLAGEEGKEDTREEASHQALYSGYPLVCGLAYKKI